MRPSSIAVFAVIQFAAGVATSDVVTFPAATRTLHGVVYKPDGPGPFPVVLYNHGSAAGMLSQQAFDALALCSSGTAGSSSGPIGVGKG